MSVVGDRYAESLFDLAKEENQVTQYLDDIKLVGEVLDSDPQIVQFFNHVLIENDKKIQLLDQSFKGNVDQYVLNFLKLLVQSRRIRYIDDIIKQAYNNVNSIIYKKSVEEEECFGMGTTLVTAILYKDNLYVFIKSIFRYRRRYDLYTL